MQGALKWTAIAHTLIDISRGLKYLHELEIIHGDIKAANVMLKSVHRSVSPVRFTAKLADLGLAQLRTHGVRIPSPSSFSILCILRADCVWTCFSASQHAV